MKWLYYGVWLLVLTVFQPTLGSGIAIFGVFPNLFLTFVIVTGLWRGRLEGMVCGFAYGLVFDLIVGQIMGLSALIYLLIGFFAGLFRENFFRDINFFLCFVIVIVGTILSELCYSLGYLAAEGTIRFWWTLGRTILPQAIYNGVIFCILYFPLRGSMRLFRTDRDRFR